MMRYSCWSRGRVCVSSWHVTESVVVDCDTSTSLCDT